MGLLRFTLAISVLFAHTGGREGVFGTALIGGGLAVMAFFVVSGFYMSLVLGSKYSLDMKGILTFYSSRFLRLFPLYWFLLAAMIVLSLLIGRSYYIDNEFYANWIQAASWHDRLFILFANLFIFGQDIIQWLAIGEDSVLRMPFYWEQPRAGTLVLLTPAWTVAIELYFYLLVPFFAKRSWPVLLALFCMSFGLRLYHFNMNFRDDPWCYRFFPCSLSLFLLGMLTHRFYAAFQPFVKKYKNVGYAGGVIIFAFMLAFFHIPANEIIMNYVFCGTMAAFIPFIFELSKSNMIDRTIGDMSYPLYLVHWIVGPITDQIVFFDEAVQQKAIIFWTIAAAYALHRFFETPLDHYRQSLVAKKMKLRPLKRAA